MAQDRGTTAQHTQLGEAEIRARIDKLLAEMTVAEKAGQLTQYFYFGSTVESAAATSGDRDEPLVASGQGDMVEAALSRGEAGSLLFVTDPAETNRLQRLTVEGNRFGIPAL